MKSDELINIFKEVSTQLSIDTDKCGYLIYTQKRNNKYVIREPEATQVLSMVLSRKLIYFGLEVPTEKLYQFSGVSPTAASIDLVIEPIEDQPNGVNVEFKADQPEVFKIQKDFEKLLREQASGSAFFHILKNSNSRTLVNLLNKYREAYENVRGLNDKISKWFVLFIFVKEKQECFFKTFDDIINIPNNDFNQNKFINERVTPTTV